MPGLQLRKDPVPERTEAEQIPVSSAKFSHVHVDIVGPFPVSQRGHKYLLTVVDCTTRWLEAVLLVDISLDSCADAFVHSWIAVWCTGDSHH